MKSSHTHRLVFMVCVIATGFVLSACDQKDVKIEKSKREGWISCISTAGKFSFDLPGKLKNSGSEDQLVNGVPIKTHFFLAEPDVSTAFSATYTDFPVSITNAPIAVLFDGGEKSALGSKGHLVSSTNSTNAGWPARRLIIERADGAWKIDVFMLMARTRLVQLTVASKQTNDVSKDVEHFFDSLRIGTK